MRITEIRFRLFFLFLLTLSHSFTTSITSFTSAFLPTTTKTKTSTNIGTLLIPPFWSTKDNEATGIEKVVGSEKYDDPSLLPQPSPPSQKIRPETTIESKRKNSRISIIRCKNLAGMTNGQNSTLDYGDHDKGVIVLNFDESTERIENNDEDDCLCGNLVSITGETGSGKSLLVSKVADLVTGRKASLSLLRSSTASFSSDNDIKRNTSFAYDGDEEKATTRGIIPPPATAEMVLSLYDESHISFVTKTLNFFDLDPNIILQIPSENSQKEMHGMDSIVMLRLKRTISLRSTNKGQQHRIKSTCFINDHLVSLKTLKAIASPLVAVVNAPVAAAALGRSSSRLSMIDNGIPQTVLIWVQQLQATYRKRKKEREELEKEQPVSMMMQRDINCDGTHDNKQLDLLRHWINELDGYERRFTDLQRSVCSGISMQTDNSEMERLLQDLNGLDWMAADYESGVGGIYATNSPSLDILFSSPLYTTLLDVYNYLKNLDAKIITVTEARDSLASLSVSDSARAALSRTRQLLMDTGPKNEDSLSKTSTTKNKVDVATEKAHQMLNHVEDVLSECATFLDDDDKGLMAILKETRMSCPITTEGLLEYITEWNTLARKHGIPPSQLPYCHDNLRKELDGGVEVGKLLPEAIIAERVALKQLEEGCLVLTEARRTLCQRISTLISRRLPRLGMENSKFEARLCSIEAPSYRKSHLGAEEVDFYLLDDEIIRHTGSMEIRNSHQIGGKIENVASSGEKARILLAIECEIPGSISAICSATAENNTGGFILPVAVIYDEIDAHMGGRASVSVAQMLFDQSKSCQVLSITHSPSLAAIATTHISIRKGKPDKHGGLSIKANRVEGIARRKELARMASGDMAVEEAEVFAEALLRDALIKLKS